MSNCPKCQAAELIWAKTAKGKNWLKDQNGNWHTCATPGKPIEVTASEPKPILEHPWGRWLKAVHGREGFYHCEKCPHHSGIFNKMDEDFGAQIQIHNSIFHSFGEDFSKIP